MYVCIYVCIYTYIYMCVLKTIWFAQVFKHYISFDMLKYLQNASGWYFPNDKS